MSPSLHYPTWRANREAMLLVGAVLLGALLGWIVWIIAKEHDRRAVLGR